MEPNASTNFKLKTKKKIVLHVLVKLYDTIRLRYDFDLNKYCTYVYMNIHKR